MREILFRGKGTCGLNAGDWIYGYYVKDFWKPTRCGFGIIPIDKERGGYCEVNPSTIGQYTGLTDKNGKKIFEGDIVITKTTSYEFVGCILYSIRYMRFVCMTKSKIPYPMDSTFEYIVIGNIHDNPELLEESDKE